MNISSHHYHIKDLLGNIRETYVHPETGYKECIQRTQYYPSGLPWAEAMVPAEQPYKYNSKEFVEMHGLDEYDSKARWYYPAICRTTTMDPLAEKYYSTSPYAWCGNNPIRNIDPDGRKIIIASDAIDHFLGVLGFNTYYRKVNNSLTQLKEIHPEINAMIQLLEQSENTYIIRHVLERPDHKEGNAYLHTINTIYFDPDKYNRGDGEIRNPIVGLAHELGHAENDEKNQRTDYNQEEVKKKNPEEIEKKNRNELNPIQKENIVRTQLNLPLRDETYIK